MIKKPLLLHQNVTVWSGLCTQNEPSSVPLKATLHFFMTLLKLDVLVIVSGWCHASLQPAKCPFMFVVNSPPVVITVTLSSMVWMFDSRPLSPNELVADWLSNKIHNNSFLPWALSEHATFHVHPNGPCTFLSFLKATQRVVVMLSCFVLFLCVCNGFL